MSDLATTDPATDVTLGVQPSPAVIADRGREISAELSTLFEEAGAVHEIQGKRYLSYPAWLSAAAMLGLRVVVEWSRRLPEGIGFEARAYVLNGAGEVVSAAEAECGADEPRWAEAPAFARRSMAETRASRRAIRQSRASVEALATAGGASGSADLIQLRNDALRVHGSPAKVTAALGVSRPFTTLGVSELRTAIDAAPASEVSDA